MKVRPRSLHLLALPRIPRIPRLHLSLQPLAFGILLLAVSCSDPIPPDIAELQKSRELLQIENGKLKKNAEADALRIHTLEEDLRVKTKDWSDRSTKMSEQSRASMEKATDLQDQINQLQAQLQPFLKTQIMEARTEAKGGVVPVLKTRSGETYTNVTIRSVVPDGIHIMHETGATKILFTNLDPSWGDRFGYNTKEADAYAKELARLKAVAQKAQWEEINAQQAQEQANLEKDKKTATNRQDQTETQVNLQLLSLRSQLFNELQQVNSEYKGRLGMDGTTKYDPENSPAFNNNLAALRLSHARDLRAQINDLKSKLGGY